MFKRTVLLISGLYCLASSHTFAQSTPTDWTPVFKSWENGCTISPVLNKFVENAIPDGKVVLPEKLKAAVGPFKVGRAEDAILYEFTLNNSTYYGLPIEKFVAYRGDGNGIMGHTLILKATEAAAKKALGKVQYKMISNEVLDYQVDISSKGNQTFVTCDESM